MKTLRHPRKSPYRSFRANPEKKNGVNVRKTLETRNVFIPPAPTTINGPSRRRVPCNIRAEENQRALPSSFFMDNTARPIKKSMRPVIEYSDRDRYREMVFNRTTTPPV